jgi:glycosyltransferase involved in cell wall biosynthesis
MTASLPFVSFGARPGRGRSVLSPPLPLHDRLKIAIVAPPWLPVPPVGYGGTENVLDTLARGLNEAGHDVLLCAAGDSTCPVTRSSVFERAVGVGSGSSVDEIRHVLHSCAARRDAGVDVVHDHTLVGPLYSGTFPDLPVVTTNHGPFSEVLIDLFRVIAGRVPVVAISAHQAETAADVPIAAVIHHGVDLADFPVGAGGGGYAVFLGRMHPGKAPHRAAEIARAAGIPLRIAAKMREPAEEQYFDTMVRPLLGDDVSYLGEVNREEKLALLGGAECLINPLGWPEPFGMVMIEALACGTPVVTTSCGAAPEIVEDGVVGWVRDTTAGLVEAAGRVRDLDRSACRRHVETKFSMQRMVARHVSLYEHSIDSLLRGTSGERVFGAA